MLSRHEANTASAAPNAGYRNERVPASTCSVWSGEQNFPSGLPSSPLSVLPPIVDTAELKDTKVIAVVTFYRHDGLGHDLLHTRLKPLLFNVTVQRSALLLRIRNVPSSNLGPETYYPDRICLWFSSDFRDKRRYSTLNCPTTASFHIIFY